LYTGKKTSVAYLELEGATRGWSLVILPLLLLSWLNWIHVRDGARTGQYSLPLVIELMLDTTYVNPLAEATIYSPYLHTEYRLPSSLAGLIATSEGKFTKQYCLQQDLPPHKTLM